VNEHVRPALPEAVARKMAEIARQRLAVNPDPLPISEPEVEDLSVDLSPSEILDRCALEPETDIGNGRRFIERYGDDVVNVARVGWHVWDGKRFKEDEDGSGVRPLAQRTAEFIDDEAILLDATEAEKTSIEDGRLALEELKELGRPQKEWTVEQIDKHDALQARVNAMTAADKSRKGRQSSRHNHAKSSAGTSKINNMLTEAAPHCARMVKDLNTDLYALNTESGTLRFIRKDGQWSLRLDAHRPRDFITKLAQVKFDPDCPAPVFERFFETVMPDEEMRRFLQRFFGYCLLGITTEHCLLFFYGAGRNGKSTLAELMLDLLGDYAVSMSIDSFAGDHQRKGSEATPDLARLPGVRLVTAEEPEQGVKLKGALIKKMTGGTKMDVRRLNQEFFEMMPHFKLVVSGNHKPIIVDDSDGMWARVHMIPFDVQIPREQIDRELPTKLRAEKNGVFAWMVRGAIDYLQHGLRPPKQVIEATEEYRQDSDPIGDFLRNGCEITGEQYDEEVPGDLVDGFRIYAKKNGLPEFNQATITRRLPDQAKKDWSANDGTKRQFWRARSNGTVYRGIKIRSEYRAAAGARRTGDDDDPFSNG
jgi:putative DNA primase/helicase